MANLTVKITKASKGIFWYAPFIGETVKVETNTFCADGKYHVSKHEMATLKNKYGISNNDVSGLIELSDAEIIKD